MAFLSKRWSAIQHGFIMFNWIGRKPAVQAPRQAARLAFPSPAPVQRPGLEALREQLYMVVRDVMLRAEVLMPLSPAGTQLHEQIWQRYLAAPGLTAEH